MGGKWPDKAKLAKSLSERVTAADWADIVDALVLQAKSGNAAAARLLVNARYGNQKWLASLDGESNEVSDRKSRLLRILKPELENGEHDGAIDGRETTGIAHTA